MAEFRGQGHLVSLMQIVTFRTWGLVLMYFQ